jgi:hypothetical protein
MTDVIAGRYALIDPIGAGGSGTVWRAFDMKRSAYCAAKLLRQRDAGGSGRRLLAWTWVGGVLGQRAGRGRDPRWQRKKAARVDLAAGLSTFSPTAGTSVR